MHTHTHTRAHKHTHTTGGGRKTDGSEMLGNHKTSHHTHTRVTQSKLARRVGVRPNAGERKDAMAERSAREATPKRYKMAESRTPKPSRSATRGTAFTRSCTSASPTRARRGAGWSGREATRATRRSSLRATGSAHSSKSTRPARR